MVSDRYQAIMDAMEGIMVQSCTRCPELVESRSQIVNGVGPADAELLIVGEAPGADEDARGKPFVGRSGMILTEKLTENGLPRNTVRITNCIRCRPPENRNPWVQELDNCREYLYQEINIVNPQLILAVGKVPAELLLDRTVAVTSEAGAIVEQRIDNIPRAVMVSLHPAAILYDRSKESILDETLGKAAEFLGYGTQSSQSNFTDFD